MNAKCLEDVGRKVLTSDCKQCQIISTVSVK